MTGVTELRFDPGPDCTKGCDKTHNGYCDLSCKFDPDPLTRQGDGA